VAARVESVAEGNFLIARLTLDALEDGSFTVADLGKLSPGLTGFYSQLFSRRFPDLGAYARDYAPLLRALAAARGPLPFSILARCSDQPA